MLNHPTLSRWTGNLLRGLPVLLFITLLTVTPALAQTPDVSTTVLREAGVKNTIDFWPVQFSADGKTVYFWEETKAGERPAGTFANVWEFKFSSDGSLSNSRCLPLKMPKPLQMTLTPDGKGMVLMAREGASFWHLDLASGALREFVTPALGQTRFVSDPRILWTDGGRIWTVGYTLDAEQLRGPHTLMELRPDRTGEAALVASGMNVDELLAWFKPWKLQSWVNPELGWVGGLKNGALEMAVWQKAKGWQSLGRFKEITSAWKYGTHQIMTGEGLDGKSFAMVFDAATGKKWDLPQIQGVYDYPFISEGGDTILLVEGPREGNRMKILYAHKSEDYKPHVLPGFESVQKGYMRLSPDGRVAVVRNQSGIFYERIPR